MSKLSPTVRQFLISIGFVIVAVVVFFSVMHRGQAEQPYEATADQAELRKSVGTKSDEAVVSDSSSATPSLDLPESSVAAAGIAADSTSTPAVLPDDDVQKAVELVDNGQVTEAVAILDSVLKKNPRDEQALVEMAMIHLLDLRQPAEASGYLERVLDINPKNQVVIGELVSLYEQQGQIDNGVEFFTNLEARGGGSPEVAYGLGQLLAMQGKDKESVQYLEKAATLPENQVKVFRDLGDVYMRLGDADKAVDSYGQSIKGQEKDIADKIARGMSVQYAEERLAYTKLEQAKAYLRKGQATEAERLLNDVRSTLPGDESVISLQHSLDRSRTPANAQGG